MTSCVNCQFYDRKGARAADARGLRWGLCRRDAPRLSPVLVKSHAVEGIWPTVRDDDWCGQWQASKRPLADAVPAALNALPARPATPPRTIIQPPSIAARALPMNGGAAAIAAGYKTTSAKSGE